MLAEDFKDPFSVCTLTGIQKLREWHKRLSQDVEMYIPTFQRLDELSSTLGMFSPMQRADFFLPFEHIYQKNFMNATSFQRVERFLPVVNIVHNARSPDRRIRIRTRAGQVLTFLIQHSSIPDPSHRSEERFHILFRMMNDLLDQSKESRNRNLQFQIPRVGKPFALSRKMSAM